MRNQLKLTALLGALAVTGSAWASIPQTIFLEADAGNGEAEATFLDTVAVSGGIAYSFLRDTTAADVGVVTAYNGSTFSTVMTAAQWTTTGSTNDMAASFGAGIVGNNARFVSFFDNNVYEINLGTGLPTEVVSKATIDAAAGVSASLTSVFETTTSGTIFAVESTGDQILAISPGNSVSVEISPFAFNSLLGGTSIGGIGVDGDTLLLGSNSSDSLVGWNTVTNAGSTVLSLAQIDAIASDPDDRNDGVVSFGDIFKAPDGLVYFYEGDGDDLLAYDPADPAGTLTVVVSEAEFEAGPSSDTINQLAWWDGQLAFTDTGEGFYVVPEPTSLAILGLAGLMVARRRRA